MVTDKQLAEWRTYDAKTLREDFDIDSLYALLDHVAELETQLTKATCSTEDPPMTDPKTRALELASELEYEAMGSDSYDSGTAIALRLAITQIPTTSGQRDEALAREKEWIELCSQRKADRDEADRLLREALGLWYHRAYQEKARAEQAEAEAERLRSALAKINTIRNSIIAKQGFNFSEHVYPLVAALDEAGFEGMPYPEALAYFGTMLERTLAAESRAEQAEARARELETRLDGMVRQRA